MTDAIDQIAELARGWGTDPDKLYQSSFKEQQQADFAARPLASFLKWLYRQVEAGKDLRKADAEHDSGLLSLIQDVADKLEIPPPEGVYLDMRQVEPNAYMHLLGWEITFVASIFAYLTADEQRALIGHELHHFRQPARAETGLFFAAQAEPVIRWMESHRLPGFNAAQQYFDQFLDDKAEQAKHREFEADHVGATLTSPEAMANALIKMYAHQFSLKSQLPSDRHASLMADEKLVQAIDESCSAWHKQFPASQVFPHGTYRFTERIDHLRELAQTCQASQER